MGIYLSISFLHYFTIYSYYSDIVNDLNLNSAIMMILGTSDSCLAAYRAEMYVNRIIYGLDIKQSAR